MSCVISPPAHRRLSRLPSGMRTRIATVSASVGAGSGGSAASLRASAMRRSSAARFASASAARWLAASCSAAWRAWLAASSAASCLRRSACARWEHEFWGPRVVHQRNVWKAEHCAP